MSINLILSLLRLTLKIITIIITIKGGCHMNYKLSSNNIIFKFSKNNPPAIKVTAGDTIEIQTCDCFADQVQTSEDKLESIDWDRINPATGPVFIEGALEGDVLKVFIEDIFLNSQGVMAAGKDLGVLGDELEGLNSKIIPVIDNKALFNSEISLPLSPMIGVIGVAPNSEDTNTGTPGSHGGNMDNTMIAKGSVLYLPVSVDGALFALGDLHAAMGDGEIGVTGIEIAGTVKVRFEVIKDLKIDNPVLENASHFTTIASSKTVDEAVDLCVHNMFELLQERLPLSRHEIVMLMSAVGETQICQVVDPLKTARFVMPKWILEKYNFTL